MAAEFKLHNSNPDDSSLLDFKVCVFLASPVPEQAGLKNHIII